MDDFIDGAKFEGIFEPKNVRAHDEVARSRAPVLRDALLADVLARPQSARAKKFAAIRCRLPAVLLLGLSLRLALFAKVRARWSVRAGNERGGHVQPWLKSQRGIVGNHRGIHAFLSHHVEAGRLPRHE